MRLRLAGAAGANRFRLKRRTLAAHAYRLTVRARDADGDRSAPARLRIPALRG